MSETGKAGGKDELVVFAAGQLTEPFQELENIFNVPWSGQNILCGEVSCFYPYGNRLRAELVGGLPLSVELTPAQAVGLSAGKKVYVSIAPEHVHIVEGI